ncbi:MAG: CoA pyrophosphatase [Pseudomonadota bacterium]
MADAKIWTVSSVRSALVDRDPLSREHGDFDYNPHLTDHIRNNARTDAAVLIGLTDSDDPHVYLTQRTKSLRTHSGQIAFPGGKIDPEDADSVSAAMRECEEEIGIRRDELDLIGELPVYISGSGFRISPVVARVSHAARVKANPDEVDNVFTVPLDFLMREENYKLVSRFWNGNERFFYEVPYHDRYIWGVTAGISRMMAIWLGEKD